VPSRKPASRNVYLPWERRGGFFRRLRLSRARPFLFVLAALALLLLITVRERQRTAQRATRAAILVARQAVDAYRADHEGHCPRSLVELETTRYFARLPKDAWGRSLRLICPSRIEGIPYQLMSDGPDGEPGGLDRIE
jgi:general secretion pathway protein G